MSGMKQKALTTNTVAVNASPLPLREAPHDSGPLWVANL
jgi:hypothetical protein